ncbi:MAG TPA: hypothetical protein VN682_26100 [Terriglobales bacterium]|nr:hypothetical protein [Terriglobales bacterium]
MRLKTCNFHPEFLFLLMAVLLAAIGAMAQNVSFDLVGPKVDVRVQRAGETLPIAQVPNLQAGDRVWIHPDLPDTQSVHYVMIVAFLRGATNPPPESWFTRVDTWTKQVHQEGIYVTVPEEAEEAVVFLAPDTGGAFSTLRGTVRAKPGAFVRAVQDLEQASLDRLRLEAYLDAVRESSLDTEQLKARTSMLARSLGIKLDQQCFDKPSAQQVPCLTQHTDQLVLDDQHSQTMVATLTTGPSTELIANISSTPTARSGYYSPYIGAVVDMARILSTAHTAQFQYIPALALPKEDQLKLRLNNPPSFRNPKSVIVIALPPVRPAIVPPLRALDATQVFCANQPELVLPADGAPLIFATDLGRKYVLHVETKAGAGFELPAEPDPARGGFVIGTKDAHFQPWDGEVTGTIRGTWGFRPFEGPHYRLRAARPGQWVVASKDASALIVGRGDTLHVQSADICCVHEVVMHDRDGKDVNLPWKVSKPDELEVKVPLQNATAGSLKMYINKFGLHEPDEISLHTFAEAGRLDSLTIYAGDSDAVLKGTRLDQVASVELDGINFQPGALSRANQHDELKLATQDSSVKVKLEVGQTSTALVTLKDSRTLDLKITVAAPRPKVTLLSKSVQVENTDPPPMIHLGNPDELPQDGRLNFFLKAQVPETFSPNAKVEVATADESFHVLLTVKDGNLTLQDSKTVFAVLDPMKLLGPSAFGPLKLRAVSPDGVEGDWQPLVNLVRMPELKAIHCTTPAKPAERRAAADKPDLPETQCTLTGDKLFLIDAISADPDFSSPVTVPDGFIEASLSLSVPRGKGVYIKLRDDPATVDTISMPISGD